jgi:hypothetical protein
MSRIIQAEQPGAVQWTLELFPELAPSARANGDGCTRPIGPRTAGRRRRAPSGPRRSPLAH